MTPARTWIIGTVLTVIVAITNIGIANGASDGAHLTAQRWSFDGIFGRFDRTAVQRGLQVYLEVCA
ncbi:MAG: cytochrome c1, partial [Alphaproteobacteria bacterium]